MRLVDYQSNRPLALVFGFSLQDTSAEFWRSTASRTTNQPAQNPCFLGNVREERMGSRNTVQEIKALILFWVTSTGRKYDFKYF